MKKRFGVFFVAIFLSLLLYAPVSYAINSKTAEEVQTWLNNEKDHPSQHGGGNCVDFVNDYLTSFWGTSSVGGNANDWTCPSGFTEVDVGNDANLLRQGDIIKEVYGSWGHVCVYYGKVGNAYMVIDQATGSYAVCKYHQWWEPFGNPTSIYRPPIGPTNKDPYGALDSASGGNRSITIRGWARDDDALGTSLSVHVYVGGPAGTSGAECHAITANKSRPDVGGNYGFSDTINVSHVGSQKIYVYAINSPQGNNPQIGSATVNISDKYNLDVDFIINGQYVSELNEEALFDVKVGNTIVAQNVGDYSSAHATNSSYEIYNIRAQAGYQYSGLAEGSDAISGTLSQNRKIILNYLSTFTVSYDANGGSNAPDSQTKVYGQPLTLSSAEPTREGYEFLGWNTDKNASTVLYAPESSYTRNIVATLYAIWKQKSYNVTFDANGGSSVDPVVLVHGASLGTLPATTRSGFIFLGWFTERTGGRQFTANEAITQDYTLYAHWSEPSMMVLPSAITTIEDEAFEGVNTNAFIIPSGVTRIGSKAFANNSSLFSVICYSETVTPVQDAFVNCPNLTIYAYEDSPIHYFAVAKKIPFEPIGQSDWVLDSEVPIGATLTGEEKWTYDQVTTETTTSETPNLEGWELVSSEWEQTKTGTHKYASFPSGFSKSHSIYNKYEKNALSAQETGTFKRTVGSATTASYVFWHWAKTNDFVNDLINDYEGESDGTYYTIFHAFESTDPLDLYRSGMTASGQERTFDGLWSTYHYTQYSSYGPWWWFRFEVMQQSYTEYKKIFTYSRQTTEAKVSYEQNYPTEVPTR